MMLTETLIDRNYIEKNLIHLFPNSIIINSRLQVISVNKGVKELLLYEENGPENWTIDKLIKSSKRKFIAQVKMLGKQGFFEPTTFELINSLGYGVKVKIAALHLGLISDMNGNIVLMVQDMDKIRRYQNQLENKIEEFNELVYRTSHDLKGPIATMQGLVNISEYESDIKKIKELIGSFNSHLKILDKKTSIISSFAEKTQKLKLIPQKLTLNQLYNITKDILDCTIGNQDINYTQSDNKGDIIYFDHQVLREIIKSVIDTVSSFDTKDYPSIHLKIISKKNNLVLIYSIKGFKCNNDIQSILQQPKLLIKEILVNEVLLKFYNLKNMITKYFGYIEFDCDKNDTYQYKISLPHDIC